MPSNGFEVKLMCNNELRYIFPSIQAAYKYVKELRPDYTRKKAFDVVNHSIDDKKSWIHNNEEYLFTTSEEIRLKRANRVTR